MYMYNLFYTSLRNNILSQPFKHSPTSSILFPVAISIGS